MRIISLSLILCNVVIQCIRDHHKYRFASDLHPMVNLHCGQDKGLSSVAVSLVLASGDTGDSRTCTAGRPTQLQAEEWESSDRRGDHRVLSVSRRQRLGKKAHVGSARASPGKFVSNYPNLEERAHDGRGSSSSRVPL